MRAFLFFLAFIIYSQIHATEFIDVNQAFKVEAQAIDAENIQFDWQIAAGYFLYSNKFRVLSKTENIELGNLQLPDSQTYQDPFFGKVGVYRQNVSFTLPINKNLQNIAQLDLSIAFQGCIDNSDDCYPLQYRTIQVNLPVDNTEKAAETVEEEKAENAPLIPDDFVLTAPQGGLSELLDLGDKPTTPIVNKDDFLKPDQAFQFGADLAEDKQSLKVYWQIAENYYLYHKKVAFELVNGGQIGEITFPKGIIKNDPTYGETEVYYHNLILHLPLKNIENLSELMLTARYQGCAEAGLCYPPIDKFLNINLATRDVIFVDSIDNKVATTSEPMQSEQDVITDMLKNASLFYTILAFFGFGLLLAFTPCIFPMIPILSGIIAGQGENITTYKAFILSLVYVLAMAVTYTAVGVIAGLIGENIQAAFQNPYVLISFSAIFVLLALSMFGFYELQLPNSWQSKVSDLSNEQKGGTLIGVAIMGFLSALIVGPCVAAPLAGALIYIGQTGDAFLGGLALFSMSLGMGLPLLAIGTSAGHFLPKAGTWMDSVKAVFGVLLIGVAIWMLERIIPATVAMWLWASLLVISAVYMGALDAVTTGWQKLWKGIGLLLMIYGIFLMISAASGGTNIFKPLAHWVKTGNGNVQQQAINFKYVKGLDEFNQAVEAAGNQIVMLDFYADWCVSCKEMELLTFSDTNVQSLMQKMQLLKTDVTPNDALDKAMYQHFEIVGPPAIMFFKDGQELRHYRVVGFMNAEKFATHLEKILQ